MSEAFNAENVVEPEIISKLEQFGIKFTEGSDGIREICYKTAELYLDPNIPIMKLHVELKELGYDLLSIGQSQNIFRDAVKGTGFLTHCEKLRSSSQGIFPEGPIEN